MLRAFTLCLAAVGVAAVGGCASFIPAYDIPTGRDGRPTVRSIVEKINCELEDIVDDPQSQLNVLISDAYDIQVGVELSLTVTDNGSLAPSFSAIDGPFTFATGFRLEQSRAQNFTEQLFFSLRSIRKQVLAFKETGDYGTIRSRCLNGPDTNLSGKLGLKEAFSLAMTSGPYLKWSATGSTGVFGGSVTFVVNKEITATGPTWRLTTFSGPGAFLTASDKNNDKLTFAFVRGPNAGKGVSESLKIQAQTFISDVRQNQIANSLNIISLSNR
ncbi:hypothetical protein [Methylobacterium oxalidis]|uniref:hypothetical protein n=1 Tax=Methylobacterium oxalidis TaxID=944322 RepID=UPI003314CE99